MISAFLTPLNISVSAALLGAAVGVLVCKTMHQDLHTYLEKYPSWFAVFIVRVGMCLEMFVGAFAVVAYADYILSTPHMPAAVVALVMFFVFGWIGFTSCYNEILKSAGKD